MYEKLLYLNTFSSYTIEEVTSFSEENKKALFSSRKNKMLFTSIINAITCGIFRSSLFTFAPDELFEKRVSDLEKKHAKLKKAARLVEYCLLKKNYKKQRDLVKKMQAHTNYTVESGISGFFQKVGHILSNGISIFEGVRGSIIWKRTTELGKELKENGYFVFYHAHSYPITLHLELNSDLQSRFFAVETKGYIPYENRRKFRAPNIALIFKNTTDYLKSSLAKKINLGHSKDDNHRETIISCDALDTNNRAYESARHFFSSGISIVDTKTSTGMSSRAFDKSFIKAYLTNDYMQEVAVNFFADARKKLVSLPGYGMIRVIAIDKTTLKNQNTNYVWRSHPFGRVCTCRHDKNSYGHTEFINTLERHQAGKVSACYDGHLPQYRILAHNLDQDRTKQIYTMDCLTLDERKTYQEIYFELKCRIKKLIRIENLNYAKNLEEIIAALYSIDEKSGDYTYTQGVQTCLQYSKPFLLKHKYELEKALPASLFSFVFNWQEKSL